MIAFIATRSAGNVRQDSWPVYMVIEKLHVQTHMKMYFRPMHNKQPNTILRAVEATSEFTCGMTQLEGAQLTSQPLQGCLKSKGVVAQSA